MKSGTRGERGQGGIPKAQEETFGNGRFVHSPDGGDDCVRKYTYHISKIHVSKLVELCNFNMAVYCMSITPHKAD